MHLKALAASTAAAALLFAGTVMAADPANFDFNGYATFPVGGPGSLVMPSVLTNNGVVPTPIPLDFTNNQYTLVVRGTLFSSSGIAQRYNNASIEIYADPIASGTPANYASLATFTDGTLILSGVFDGFLTRNTFTPTLGNFVGKVDFTGGTLLGLLATPQDWPFGGGWSRTISGIPSGYQENWDGKIDLATVATESLGWDAMKSLYR